MSLHGLLCPHCGHELMAEFSDAVGGLVQNNVKFVDPDTGLPIEFAGNPTAAGASTDFPQATDAAVRHADALGVDLAEVEGTGAPVSVPVVTTEEVPAITKADVAAHAEANPPEEPVNEQVAG